MLSVDPESKAQVPAAVRPYHDRPTTSISHRDRAIWSGRSPSEYREVLGL